MKLHFGKKKKGFTLVEIIVALAILGIIAVSFISMFTFGFISILSGNRTSKAQNDAQGSIEAEIGNTVLPDSIETLSIDFPGQTIAVKGSTITFTQNYFDSRRLPRDVELVTFAPGRIFLSKYLITLKSGNLSETISVLSDNPSNLECFAVRLDGKSASDYVNVTNNILSNGTITITAGSTKSSDQKTLLIVRSTAQSFNAAICTIVYE